MSDENLIIARNLRKSYGKGPARVQVLRGLDLSVRKGEFLAVMGPSGCGKTTLLHLLGLMNEPDVDPAGDPLARSEILFDGVSVLGDDSLRMRLRRRQIGFVFQRFNLLEVLTARQNVDISLSVRGLEADGRVDELFSQMNVSHVAGRKPGQMSIGEQQRVAVIRAVAHRPALLLADEPTGNLDSANAGELLDLMVRMNRDHGQTIVMITHSAEAAQRAHRIVRMKDGKIGE